MTVVQIYRASWQTLSMCLLSRVFWKILQRGILSPKNKGYLAMDTFPMLAYTDQQWLLRYFPVSYKSAGTVISSEWIQTGVCPAPPCSRIRDLSFLSSGISSSGMAKYFRMVVGDECSNCAMSDIVRLSFRFLWANLIRSDLFAVLYSAAISSEIASANGISTLAGNSLMIYLFMASESPFI